MKAGHKYVLHLEQYHTCQRENKEKDREREREKKGEETSEEQTPHISS